MIKYTFSYLWVQPPEVYQGIRHPQQDNDHHTERHIYNCEHQEYQLYKPDNINLAEKISRYRQACNHVKPKQYKKEVFAGSCTQYPGKLVSGHSKSQACNRAPDTIPRQ